MKLDTLSRMIIWIWMVELYVEAKIIMMGTSVKSLRLGFISLIVYNIVMRLYYIAWWYKAHTSGFLLLCISVPPKGEKIDYIVCLVKRKYLAQSNPCEFEFWIRTSTTRFLQLNQILLHIRLLLIAMLSYMDYCIADCYLLRCFPTRKLLVQIHLTLLLNQIKIE